MSLTTTSRERSGFEGASTALRDDLDSIHRRHADSTLAAARRRLGDLHRAEEVVQEVFLDLWMRPERFDRSRGSVAAFLAVQANSRALDRIRSDAARQRRDEQEARMSVRIATSPDDDDERIAAADRVRRVLAGLPEHERVPISMAFYQGRTYRQVAESLGVPEGTIKSRIRCGLRRMRDSLVDGSGLDPAF